MYVFWKYSPPPTYRKNYNGKFLCVEMESFKKYLTVKYWPRTNKEVHDVLIHITDNPLSSARVCEFLKKFNIGETEPP